MSDDNLRIERDELFTTEVDQALARERAGRERIVADTPPVSPVRRLLLNSMFHLPLAAVVGALVCWLLLEPKIDDMPSFGGEVILVNADPFDAPDGIIAITVGDHVAYVDVARVKLEPGAHGEPALASAEDIQVGDRIEVTGLAEGPGLVAAAIRPTSRSGSFGAVDQPVWPLIILFPLTAALIAFGLLFAEGLTTRNWLRMAERALLGSFLASLFALLAFIPAGLFMWISGRILHGEVTGGSDALIVTVREVSGSSFFFMTVCRSAAWACVGAATGVGMNLVRATRPQLRNSAIGGALGGALGGMFFDPIDRFGTSSLFAGSESARLVGLLAVGLSVGVFVALVERLARDAWLRVRTGPLAGKSFILFKTPTVIGNAPASDVYLYKDAEIDPAHASIHRVGTTYEIEDLGSRMGTEVGGTKVRRRRLVSGDQIVVGSTILDFEERQKRTPQGG
ncbi:MAG: FHA domain-containing protein [Myxococcales bacterium]|nr:FHA domain-containing protein [Myxococcales bacterium]